MRIEDWNRTDIYLFIRDGWKEDTTPYSNEIQKRISNCEVFIHPLRDREMREGYSIIIQKFGKTIAEGSGGFALSRYSEDDDLYKARHEYNGFITRLKIELQNLNRRIKTEEDANIYPAKIDI